MPDRITTHEAAIEEMLRWANGERSHWNEVLAESKAEGSPSATALTALVDAAEVQKWAAVARALEGCGERVGVLESMIRALRNESAARLELAIAAERRVEEVRGAWGADRHRLERELAAVQEKFAALTEEIKQHINLQPDSRE